jgi:hypothetical protein
MSLFLRYSCHARLLLVVTDALIANGYMVRCSLDLCRTCCLSKPAALL